MHRYSTIQEQLSEEDQSFKTIKTYQPEFITEHTPSIMTLVSNFLLSHATDRIKGTNDN